MVTTQLPVLCHLIWTHNVRTESLITNNIKKTDRAPVGKPIMLTLVLRGGCMLLQTVVSGILLTASAVPLRLRTVVHPIIP